MVNLIEKYWRDQNSKRSGFTLVESIIGIAIFVILAGAVYQTFFIISKEASFNWSNTAISSLADQYLEIARNLPYSQIGTVQGNPHGNLPDLTNPTTVVTNGKTYQIYYEVTYIDDPADGTIAQGTDPAPNDYKQVKLSIKDVAANTVTNFSTNIVPTGLENLTSGGALFISVINAVGQPVPGATINITNNALNPTINLTRTSNSVGTWAEVGLPDSSNSYHIVVTKNGYSTDQTYAITTNNPNPTKPDATISNGQVTQVSFAIDQTSNLVFNTLNQTCGAIGGVGVGIEGSKLIGTSPDVFKFNNSYTSDSNGKIQLNNIEWDNYIPALLGSTYMIYGSSPIQQINVMPNTSQTFNLILGNKTTNSLLTIVKDGATGNPIEGASVNLTNTSPSYNNTLITGGSLWSQLYWNGGSGQTTWTDTTKYFQDDGGVSTTGIPLAIRLANSGGNTLTNSGWLISSTFDTGSDTTSYTTLGWQPTSQDPSTSVKFQIATNNDNTTWNFVGPDGTSNTYYTTPDTTISTTNNNNRYIRYKAYLSTNDPTKNPTITSVGINYVSGCFTPGQVFFPGLTASDTYQLSVSMPGYLTNTITGLQINGYVVKEVSLSQ
ncbi:MAG: prepilin-type N-terminal cleavage/methylation domain-containing protein [Patescibacteria group bacterium]|nr:prepilin-type N-terminal cleavage/methylation domain-containing protein [Patescibacteria group bacterium]